VVELCQAPVDEPQLPLLVVNHDVVRLDVTVHDALAMAAAKTRQQTVSNLQQVDTILILPRQLLSDVHDAFAMLAARGGTREAKNLSRSN